jgi:hypothetical protein
VRYGDPLGLRTRQQIIDLVPSGHQPEKPAKEFEFIEGWPNPHRRHPPTCQMSSFNYERRFLGQPLMYKPLPLH